MSLESELVARNVLEQSRKNIKREVSVAIKRLSDDYHLARQTMRRQLRVQTRALAHIIRTVQSGREITSTDQHAALIRGLSRGENVDDVVIFEIDNNSQLIPAAVTGYDAAHILANADSIKDLLGQLGERSEGFVLVPDILGGASALMYLLRLENQAMVIASVVNLEVFEKDLKQRSLEQLSRVRYGADGYIFVYRNDGTYLMNPFFPSMAGKQMNRLDDVNGQPVWQAFIQAAGKPEGTFIDYRWTRPGSDTVEDKITYVRPYPRWGWVIASGVYVEDALQVAASEQAALHERVQTAIDRAILISLLVVGVIFILTLVLARNTSLLLRRYQSHMAQQNLELNSLNTQLEQRILERTQELQQKNERLRQLSSTDPLTGLSNRLRLDQVFEKALSAAKRYGRPFSIILMDLDHFKSINDTWGHGAGDEVLRQVARLLEQSLRDTDLPGRWGGEEFLIILPETSQVQALAVAEKLRVAVYALDVPPVTRLTSSFGVTHYEEGDSIEGMIARADSALYEAKASGRNRVISGPAS